MKKGTKKRTKLLKIKKAQNKAILRKSEPIILGRKGNRKKIPVIKTKSTRKKQTAIKVFTAKSSKKLLSKTQIKALKALHNLRTLSVKELCEIFKLSTSSLYNYL